MANSTNDELFIHHLLKYCNNFLPVVAIATDLFLLQSLAAIAKPSDRQTKPSNPLSQLQDLSQNIPTTPAIIPQANSTIPVGLNMNGKNILPSMNVRGYEDGENAVNFENWLVPFDEVVEALKFKTKEAINGQIEISSPLFKFQLPANRLLQDPQLGRAIAIRDLNTIPRVTAKFNINKYAIEIVSPSLDWTAGNTIVEQPIEIDGLPIAKPAGWGVGAIQERVNFAGQNGNSGGSQGELKAIGNIFDASWYLRLDQSQFDLPKNWNITDGIVIRQRPKNDIAIGSQTPFWRSPSGYQNGTYWGATSIWREGFTPPTQSYGSDFSIGDRLQSSRIGRSIAGQAVPGTLVQLVNGTQLQVIKESLVDSSGVYRFDNVVVNNNIDNPFGQDYRVLLYPNAQLTASPEIRPAQFVTTPGQLPTGASALVVSAGGNRIAAGNFGNFDAVQGGALYRRGVNENLTVGVGAAFERQLLGVGEIFWQPDRIPLQVAVSATTGAQGSILGRVDYNPSPDFFFTGNIDRLSTRSAANWRVNNNFTALSNYDSRRGTSIGGQYNSNNSRYNSTYLRAELDDRARLRFSANQRLDNWQLSHQSNESASTTQVIYKLDKNLDRIIDAGHELVASYQTNTQTAGITNSSPDFTSLVWRYRSPERTDNGRSRWQTELGYGLNSFGNGAIAGIDLNLAAGLQLRGSYRGVSENNGRNSYSIELNTTLLTSNGIQGTDGQIEDLRTQGQVKLTAFMDNNSNGRQDPGEAAYYDPLLFKINQKQLKYFQVANSSNAAIVKLPPDSYRLDIDPAGYPINYRAAVDAIRLEISAGNFTPISIPLVPAYVYTGEVRDSIGNPVPGARVEAISLKKGTKISSITNGAGIYYLEGLEQGEYQLKVGNLPTAPDRLLITYRSQFTQELNISVTLPSEKKPLTTPLLSTPTRPTFPQR
jgi:hypothetical protein